MFATLDEFVYFGSKFEGIVGGKPFTWSFEKITKIESKLEPEQEPEPKPEPEPEPAAKPKVVGQGKGKAKK
jgi:hypothetical protein